MSKEYEKILKGIQSSKPKYSNNTPNQKAYNKLVDEFEARMQDIRENYSEIMKHPKKKSSITATRNERLQYLAELPQINPNRITKADIIEAEKAVQTLREVTAKADIAREQRRLDLQKREEEKTAKQAQAIADKLEKQAQKEQTLADKARQKEEAKRQKQVDKVVQRAEKQEIKPDSEKHPIETTDEPANADFEIVQNTLDILNSASNQIVANLMIEILYQSLGTDPDGTLQRLNSADDFPLDLATAIAYESNPQYVIECGEKLAELITGSDAYNRAIAEATYKDVQRIKADIRRARKEARGTKVVFYNSSIGDFDN